MPYKLQAPLPHIIKNYFIIIFKIPLSVVNEGWLNFIDTEVDTYFKSDISFLSVYRLGKKEKTWPANRPKVKHVKLTNVLLIDALTSHLVLFSELQKLQTTAQQTGNINTVNI